MSNLVKHAERELELAGMGEKSTDINKAMHDHIIRMVKEFSKEGHSGFSASYAIGVLSKLLNFENLTPLTGEPDEWLDLATDAKSTFKPDDLRYQNKRDGRVFKLQNGKVIFSEGKIFIDRDGTSWQNRKSSVEVKQFPFTPKTKRVQRRWWKVWL